MRIYNGKDSQLDLPLGNGERLSVGPKSISKDFLPSTSFISMIVSTFDYSEIALVVSGIIELNLCNSVSCAPGFIAYNVADAVERFAKKNQEYNPANLSKENVEKAEKSLDEFKKKERKRVEKTEEKTTPSENPSNS